MAKCYVIVRDYGLDRIHKQPEWRRQYTRFDCEDAYERKGDRIKPKQHRRRRENRDRQEHDRDRINQHPHNKPDSDHDRQGPDRTEAGTDQRIGNRAADPGQGQHTRIELCRENQNHNRHRRAPDGEHSRLDLRPAHALRESEYKPHERSDSRALSRREKPHPYSTKRAANDRNNSNDAYRNRALYSIVGRNNPCGLRTVIRRRWCRRCVLYFGVADADPGRRNQGNGADV